MVTNHTWKQLGQAWKVIVVFCQRGFKDSTQSGIKSYFKDNENEFQSCWIKIINDLGPNRIIGCYYKHPKKPSNNKFLEQLKIPLTKIKNWNEYIIVCSDFNYNLLNHQNDEHVDEFLNIIISHFLQPCITEPTRMIAGQRPSIVDNIFTNIFEKSLNSGNLDDKITDHLPNFSFIVDFIDQQKNKKIRIKNMKAFNEKLTLRTLIHSND